MTKSILVHLRVHILMVGVICSFWTWSIAEIPPHDPPLEECELLTLRESLIKSTGAEKDIVTWVYQEKKTERDSRFLERLQPPESFFEEGVEKGQEILSQLIKDLANGATLPSLQLPYRDLLRIFYQNYLNALQTATPEGKSQILEPKVIIQSDMMGPYRISQAMAYQILCMNQYGDVIRGAHGGSHPVNRVGEVFFKRSVRYKDEAIEGAPLQPAMESALYHGYRLLFGEGYLAPTTLLTFRNVQTQYPDLDQSEGLTERQKGIITDNAVGMQLESYLKQASSEVTQNLLFKQISAHYVAQAALAIEGEILHKYMEAHSNQTPLFDECSFSAHVLGSYIFPTQDAKFDNFMVVETAEGKQKIIGIDNDLALEPALKSGHTLNLKNGLYLYKKEMNQAIEASIRYFITQIPVESFLLHWLKSLEELDHAYQNLLTHGCLLEEDYRYNALPFRVSSSQLRNVGKNLLTLQSLIKEEFYAQRITHQQLLRLLYPQIEKFYEGLQDKLPSPGELMIFQMDHIFRAEPKLEVLPSLYPSFRTASLEKPPEETSKKPLTEAVQEVIETFALSYNKTEADWVETLGLIWQLFPHQGISILKSLLEKNPSLNRLGKSPDFMLKALRYQQSVDILKLAVQFLGFDVKRHEVEVLTTTIESLPEEKGITCLQFLIGYGVDLEIPISLTGESVLDKAMCLNKHQYVVWLIENGAGKNVKISLALNYIGRLSGEVRGDFESVLPLLERHNPALKWQLMLDTFLPRPSAAADIEGIEVKSPEGTRVLPAAFVAQLWENLESLTGFKKINNYGRRQVGLLQQGRYTLYVKEHPELPGIEEAVGMLTRKLFGFGAPRTLLTRIGNTAYLFTEGIEGENLQDCFREEAKRWREIKDRIDPYAFGCMALAAMLTNPEDGKPDNYMVQEADGAYRLICIDNDHAFVPSVAPVRLFERKIYRVQVKSVLFAMEQMKISLHPRLKEQFLYHMSQDILGQWVQQLSGTKLAYEDLFRPQEAQAYFNTHGSFIGLGLLPSTIHKLYRNLVDLQYLIERQADLTLFDILRQFNRSLYERYRKGFEGQFASLNPYERFLKLDGGDYDFDSRSQSLMTTRHAQHLLSSVKLEDKTLLDYIKAGRHQELSPESALEKLKEMAQKDTKVLLRQILEGEERADLQEMTDAQKEDFFNRLDWSKLPFPVQQTLLLQLTAVSFRGHLTLKNCAALTGSVTRKLPWDTITALTVIIEDQKDCQVFQKVLGNVPEEKPIHLIMKNIETIDDTVLDQMIQSHEIKTLKLENCGQVDHPKLRERAPHLVWKNLPDIVKRELRRVFETQETKLCLGKSRLGDAGMAALAEVIRGSVCVQELDLSDNKISPKGAQMLAAGLKGSAVQQLNLEHNNIGNSGAQALAAVLEDSAVQHLNLGNNNISNAGAVAFGRWLKRRAIQLNLGHNNIGNAGVQSLAAVLKDSAVQQLNLEHNNIGNVGVQALAIGLAQTQVQQLNLGNNHIGGWGAQSLADSLVLSQIQLLDLGHNRICAQGAKALAAVLKDSAIQQLNLSHNNIGDEGAQALGAGLKGSPVQKLNLERNQIGPEGVRVLAIGLVQSRVQQLNLGRNHLGCLGAQELATNLPKTQLRQLNLSYNNIGHAGVQMLADVIKDSILEQLDVDEGEGGMSYVYHLDDIEEKIRKPLAENRRRFKLKDSSQPSLVQGQQLNPDADKGGEDAPASFYFGQLTTPSIPSWERAKYKLLDPDVNYQSVLNILAPDLGKSAEALEFCYHQVAPNYPQAYLKLAESIEGTAEKLFYLQKALQSKVREALPQLVTLYKTTNHEKALLLLVEAYRGESFKDTQKAFDLYKERLFRHESAECNYQLATLYLENEGIREESLKKVEPLLERAMQEGHGLAHLLWKNLQTRQDALMFFYEKKGLDVEAMSRLDEEKHILQALYVQQYQPFREDAFLKQLKQNPALDAEVVTRVLAPFQAEEQKLEKQRETLKNEITHQSKLSPHYKRLALSLMSIEEKLKALQYKKGLRIEEMVLGPKTHYAGLIKNRQLRFYQKLYEVVFEEKELIATNKTMYEQDIKTMAKLLSNQVLELAIEIPLPNRSLAQLPNEIIAGTLAATYAYRLQELTPFLTESSQDVLCKNLVLNFVDYLQGKNIDFFQDISLLLSQSFYHQRDALGTRLSRLLGRSHLLRTVYKDELPLDEIYAAAYLVTNDGAKWRDKTQENSLTVNKEPLHYHVPYLEIVYLKQQTGVKLIQSEPSRLSYLQREITIPQDSQRYLEATFRFIHQLKGLEKSSYA